MRVCVTGGAGFIGSHLVEALLARGHGVVVLDDLSAGRRENLPATSERLTWIEASVCDAQAVRRAVDGAEVVYHLAAQTSVARSVESPEQAVAVNAGGTVHVLQAAHRAGTRRVVLASSSSVYGDGETLPKVETMALRPRSPYAASKCAAEAYLLGFGTSYGLETLALRFFNVYGPRQRVDSAYGAALPLFLAGALRGEAPVVHGDGEQTRDFTFVADVVAGVCLAGETEGVPSGPLNLGRGERTSILALARQVIAATGLAAELTFAPARVGDVRHSQADATRARAVLGWEPRVGLAEGIERTLAWMRAAAG